MFAAADPVLRIDGDAVARNLATVRARLGAARLIAVVKDNAYGHGMLPIARALQARGVDAFAVGCVDEAWALRATGVVGRVLNLRLFRPEEADRIAKGGLVQAVFTREQVACLAAAARRAGRRVRVHVKVDTGLRRFGVPVEDAEAFLRETRESGDLEVEGVLSTLTEDPSRDPGQIAAFCALREAAGRRDGETWSLAASHGLLHHPDARLDAVRVGALLYGFPPSGEPVPGLSPISRFEAAVLGARRLRAGDRVGFRGRWPVAADTTAVFLGVGILHGLRASLASGGEAILGGRRCPIRIVATDHLVVEWAGGDPPPRPGDRALLIGREAEEEIPLAEFAARMGESPYRALVGTRSRVQRALIDEPAGPAGYGAAPRP